MRYNEKLIIVSKALWICFGIAFIFGLWIGLGINYLIK